MGKIKFNMLALFFCLLGAVCAIGYYRSIGEHYISAGFSIFLALACLKISLSLDDQNMAQWSRFGLATVPFLLMPCLLLLDLVSSLLDHSVLFGAGKVAITIAWFCSTLYVWRLFWK